MKVYLLKTNEGQYYKGLRPTAKTPILVDNITDAYMTADRTELDELMQKWNYLHLVTGDFTVSTDALPVESVLNELEDVLMRLCEYGQVKFQVLDDNDAIYNYVRSDYEGGTSYIQVSQYSSSLTVLPMAHDLYMTAHMYGYDVSMEKCKQIIQTHGEIKNIQAELPILLAELMGG